VVRCWGYEISTLKWFSMIIVCINRLIGTCAFMQNVSVKTFRCYVVNIDTVITVMSIRRL
jgi:hypothetical protein